MKKSFKIHCFTVFLFGAISLGVGAEIKASPLEGLMRLVGRWEGEAHLTLEGTAYKFNYQADFRKTADGKGLLMEEGFNSPELGKMAGTNLIGYNEKDGKIHWFSVDNMGTTHDHLGTWSGPDKFRMEVTEMSGKQKYVEKIELQFEGEDVLNLKLTATLGGKDYETLMAVFKRLPAVSAK